MPDRQGSASTPTARLKSTNARALAVAADGDPGNIWVVSDHQTEGRGRRGRHWSTEPGNLAASILVVVDVGAEQAATLGFVAGLSLDRALARIAPDWRQEGMGRLQLKWPNDVLVDGRKVAGILLEARHLYGDRMAIAVGIGINIVSAPRGPALSGGHLFTISESQRMPRRCSCP